MGVKKYKAKHANTEMLEQQNKSWGKMYREGDERGQPDGEGTASTERDEGAAAVVSIISDEMTSLNNPFNDSN